MKHLTFIKNIQTKQLSKTWHDQIVEKTIVRNNFKLNENLHEAKKFVKNITSLQVHLDTSNSQPIVIYQR